MKIKGGTEPPSNEIDKYALTINSLIAAVTRDDFIELLRFHTPLTTEAMMDLTDWKDVLNRIDDHIESILYLRRHQIILVQRDVVSIVTEEDTVGLERDIRYLTDYLNFTSSLLKNSVHKDTYNSTEHLIELLSAYNGHLMILALDCLLSLTYSPQQHRCNVDNLRRHTTAVHRNVAYFDPLLDIVDGSYTVTCVPIQVFLSETFEPNVIPDWKTIKLDLIAKPRNGKTVVSQLTTDDSVLTEKSFETFDFDRFAGRDMREIFKSERRIPPAAKVHFMYSLRMRSMLSTLKDRTELIRLQYQAALILLECHPDSATLFAFFQDKVCMIQSFLYLLRTGPGSLDYCPGLIPVDIRLLACHCLEAIVGARDSPSSPMLVHYPWILHDLGVNRGQYMGLFPCLIRSSISYLISLEEKEAEHGSSSSTEN